MILFNSFNPFRRPELSRDYNCDSTTTRLQYNYDPTTIRLRRIARPCFHSTRAKMSMSIFHRSRVVVEPVPNPIELMQVIPTLLVTSSSVLPWVLKTVNDSTKIYKLSLGCVHLYFYLLADCSCRLSLFSANKAMPTPVVLVTKFWRVATNVRRLYNRRATITVGFAALSILSLRLRLPAAEEAICFRVVRPCRCPSVRPSVRP